MKLFRRCLSIFFLIAIGQTSLYATSTASEINERDIQAVRQHLKSKRDQRLSDKHDEMGIAGDVRFEYKHLQEKIDGVKQRGNSINGVASKGTDEFDVEVNLYFDYQTDTTFAAIKLEFDNDAGISHSCGDDYNCGSGQCNAVCLERAYFGWHVWEDGDSRLDITMGRSNLHDILDSRIQFQSQYDGAWVDFHTAFADIGKFYMKSGAFVIDSVASNWGYFVEAGLTDIVETGLDLKYSFIDWTKKTDRKGIRLGDAFDYCARSWNFRNSQWAAAYSFEPEFIGKKVKLYGAFLVNHAARKSTSASGKKENLGWYAGFMIGKVKGQGDWSLDANYQYVQAQSIAEFEASGIGRGNCGKRCYAKDFAGNTNYEGLLIEGLYGISDNLKLDLEAEFSRELSKAAGGNEKVRYAKYEIEFIYSF